MIELIEGKRGLPRHRPPYVAQVGLFGRPTLVNNIETLFWVRDIVEKGGEWFASQGRRGRKGLRSFSVSGRVKNPGVKLAPAGVTMQELIDEFSGGMADGHAFKGYLPGGASGGILPASMADIPLDFGTLEQHGCFVGSHAVVVLSDKDNMREVALNLMRFFEDESLRPVHALPGRHRKGGQADDAAEMERQSDHRVVAGDDRCVDLRSGTGGSQSGEVGPQALPRGRVMSETIRFTLDGEEVEARADETIWQVANRRGTEIPHLCYTPAPGYRPDGNCRACMVEVEGERVLAASCIRKPAAGMKVKSASERAKSARKMVFELLVTDQPDRATAHDPDSRLWHWADHIGVDDSRFAARGHAGSRTRAIRRCASTSTPASTAICVCAPAARSRSTTSSAWPGAATTPRSSSTSTTRWATAPASPAANACRPARPAP